MSGFHQPTSPRWFTTPRFRVLAFSLLALIVAVEAVFAIFRRENDFECHWDVGRLFLDHKPYHEGSFIMYPLARIMMDGLLALAPSRVSRGICFFVALLAVYGTYRIWRRLSDDGTPVRAATALAAAAITALLMIGYFLRDLDECGLQLFLLFFLSAALYDLVQGWPMRSGFWLATAASYKAVPLLFLPYLLWKRQWQAAGWMVVFIGVWSAAPIPYLGLEKTVQAQKQWLAHVGHLSANRQAYPDQLVEPQRTDNLSLAALIARNLETYPPGHPLFVDHPWFWQPGDLTPAHAYLAVRAMLMALGLVLAWRFRRSCEGPLTSNGLVAEWSAVCLLCGILSPIVWKQHLVVELPALFLLVQATLSLPVVPRWRIGVLTAICVLANLSSSFFLNGNMRELAHVYKLDAFAALLLLTAVLNLPARTRTALGAETAPPLVREQARAA